MKISILLILILIACNDRKTEVDTRYEDLAPEPLRNESNRDMVATYIDSILLSEVAKLKDSVLSIKHSLIQILNHRQDGDCAAADTIFLLGDSSPILLVETSWCASEEYFSTSIYDRSNLVYYNYQKKEDGLMYESNELYYRNNQPIFGFQTNFKWDFKSRTLLDSMSVILSVEKLVKITEQTEIGNDSISARIYRLKDLRHEAIYNKKYKIIDTLQNMVEESYYLVDSSLFATWLTNDSIR